jgi:hypothetical protein
MTASYFKNILCYLVILTAPLSTLAQMRNISGTVTDAADKQTIPGVTVVVPGTAIGTITDLEGYY